MNMLKKISLALVGAVLALASVASAMAYATVYPYEYGQPRIGAYTSNFGAMGCAQGMYCYLSPPVAQTRYGADYYVTNIRTAVYPAYPFTYVPQMDRPYFGYPYGLDRRPYVHWSGRGPVCGTFGC